MIKELLYLCKLFFSKVPPEETPLENVILKHFPFKGYGAMMWCGKLISRSEVYNIYTWNHEKIHLRQAQKCGSWFIYYSLYLWYYVCGLGLPKDGAYFSIPFEMEAYANQENLGYTKISWKRYKIKNRRRAWLENMSSWKKWIKTI